MTKSLRPKTWFNPCFESGDVFYRRHDGSGEGMAGSSPVVTPTQKESALDQRIGVISGQSNAVTLRNEESALAQKIGAWVLGHIRIKKSVASTTLFITNTSPIFTPFSGYYCFFLKYTYGYRFLNAIVGFYYHAVHTACKRGHRDTGIVGTCLQIYFMA